MTDFAEYSNDPSWQKHGSTPSIEEEEYEFLPELSDLETPTVGPTKASLFYRAFITWHNARILSRQSKSFNPVAHSKTDSIAFGQWSGTLLPAGETLVFRQAPETRWIQNIRHPSYQLRQPIPFVIAHRDGIVTANYDDLDLNAHGENLQAAIAALCEKIVACYEEGQEPSNHHMSSPTQEQEFLKQIIVDTQPKAWEGLKQLYAEELKAFSYVDKGYIHISAPDYADVILILSEESADRITRLAGIDLEINQKFLPLNFTVEYKSSEEYVDLSDFVRFL